MGNKTYIQDDFGNQVPLLDDYGNLSLEVIMLYAEDKLTAADRKAVDDFTATDEISKDALDGFLLTSNSSKTRHQLGQLNAEIQKATGAKAVSSFAQPKKEFPYGKLAAAVALLLAVGGGTFFAAQFLGEDDLAEATEKEAAKPERPRKERVLQPTVQSADTTTAVLEASNLKKDEAEPEERERNIVIEDEVAQAESEFKSETENVGIVDVVESADNDETEEAPSPQVEAGELALNIADNSSEELENEDSESEKRKQELEQYQRLAKAQEADNARKSEDKAKEVDQKVQAELSAELASKTMAESVSNTAHLRENDDAYSDQGSYQQEAAAEESQEVNARFPGGDLEMYRFIEKNKRYTEAMSAEDLKGSVVVSFQIDREGNISKVKTQSGQTGLLEQDAVRVIESMPQWEPAVRPNGNTAKSARVITIRYGE